eukprot:CAMPEP_0204639880 /NCGR_PEP_ID=MMETSP0717-20131115/44803_1 /ASSEMBLY_ACC=CAM_ASM_000666 /TAXON_ID=230516 /ORGANISM="Chaetoceros curvisetus" /LENGTH=120 /DNA_ID=CAMNT_0051660127 /DNA_START=122 /DNA_END=484 /DNA_ORIENTATION=+
MYNPKKFVLLAASLLSAAQATALSSFTGEYDDPNHPNCKRSIMVIDSGDAKVSGTDGDPGCPPDGSGKAWSLDALVKGDTIVVDFSPKGGPSDLSGKRTPEGILWEDGNTWTDKVMKAAE